jgi:hypothetical protein
LYKESKRKKGNPSRRGLTVPLNTPSVKTTQAQLEGTKSPLQIVLLTSKKTSYISTSPTTHLYA